MELVKLELMTMPFAFFVHFGFPTGLAVLPTQPRACCVGKVCCIVRCFKATRIYMQRAQ